MPKSKVNNQPLKECDLLGATVIQDVLMDDEPIQVGQIYLPGDLVPALSIYELENAIRRGMKVSEAFKELVRNPEASRYRQELKYLLEWYRDPRTEKTISVYEDELKWIICHLATEVAAYASYKYPTFLNDARNWLLGKWREQFLDEGGRYCEVAWPYWYDHLSKGGKIYHRWPVCPPKITLYQVKYGDAKEASLPAMMADRNFAMGASLFLAEPNSFIVSYDDVVKWAVAAQSTNLQMIGQ